LKIGPQGHVYLPKKIRRTFGDNLKFLPNANAAVIYPQGMDPETVIRSLQVIMTDLRMRVQEKKTKE
jgi:hypothetical protein